MTKGLGRPAAGMGRFMLDCGWWRHPHFRGLSPEALHVWQAGVSFSMENATDGRLGTTDVEDLAIAIGVKVSWTKKATKELIERQLWVEVDGPYGPELEMTGYAEHNPTKAEIEGYTEERSELGRMGNHKRWHVNKNMVDPKCPLCTGEVEEAPASDPDTDRSSDRTTDPETVARSSHGMGWDGNPLSPPSLEPRSRIDQATIGQGLAAVASLRGAS